MSSQQKGYERQLGQLAETQGAIAKEQWQLYSPNIQYTLGQVRGQLDQGFGSVPKYVREAFDSMEGKTRSDYAKAGLQSQERLQQQMKQQGTGGMISPTASAALQQRQNLTLAESQNQALANMRMQEAMTGLQTSMSLLDILRGGTGQAGSMAMQGFANQSQLLQYLMGNAGGDRTANTVAGAAGGAMSGYSATGSPYGALAGAAIGGYSGYANS